METIRMFVNGQALTGGSLHHALSDATFMGSARTAARYRFYSVRDEFPGLYPASEGGVPVPGEVYELPYQMLRERLLPREPAELELTIIELEDGTGSLSMRMRETAMTDPDVVDITEEGGWLRYLASRND